MRPEEREQAEFRRIQLTDQMEKDRRLIATYRANEWYYINRLIDASRELGELDERLQDES
jgi:hypothetical protein